MGPLRLHITGAAGTGKTTLGREFSRRFSLSHLDTVDFVCEKTDPPYRVFKDDRQRRRELALAMENRSSWVLSGSLCGWGDVFIPRFTHVVFLHTSMRIRLRRLVERQYFEFGDRVRPNGDMHDVHCQFMTRASAYDAGTGETHCLERDERWLESLSCPWIAVDASFSTEEQVRLIDIFVQG